MKNILVITLTLVFLLIGCGSNNSDTQYKMAEEELHSSGGDHSSTTYDEEKPSSSIDRSEVIEQKIIKEAWVDIQVKDYEDALKHVKFIISSYNGYISKENEYKTDYALTNQLEIRVPNESFDTLVEEITGIADIVERKNIEAKDVTEEYVDILARLKTKKEVEKRYLELLKQARSVNDVLNVERELQNIREEIESAEGRLKYLSNKISYSTLYLEVSKELPTVTNFRFFNKVKEGLGIGWKLLLNILLGIIYVWPLVILGIGIWWLIRRRIRKRRAKKEES